MNVLDVHAIISIWEEKSYNLNCFKLFFTTITKQVMTAYTITNHSYWHRPMCIFVCEVPAGSSCLSVLSLCISVLDSTGGLTFTHAIILITIKILFKRESLLKDINYL